MKSSILTRPGIRPLIAGFAVVAALLFASAPVASAHQGHPSRPGKPPAPHGPSGHPHGAPGHSGHVGAPGN